MNTDLLRAFDRVRIVSLPDRQDRRRAVAREFARLALPIDGDRIGYFDAIRPDDAGEFPSVGARGCFLSHLQVLRDARADGVQRLLVLEDDVQFARPGPETTRLAHQLAGLRWDLCYPGHAQEARPGPLRWIESAEPLVCAHCYGVHGDALAGVVDFLEACLTRRSGHPLGSPMHVDGALSLMRSLQPHRRTWIASRSLARQRSSRSDISGPSWIDRLPLPWLAPAARALRNHWRGARAA